MDREKVDGPDVLVSLEKAPPVLGALTVPRTNIGTPQNIADRGFRDIDSDLKEFAVNSFRAPESIFHLHANDEFFGFRIEWGTP